MYCTHRVVRFSRTLSIFSFETGFDSCVGFTTTRFAASFWVSHDVHFVPTNYFILGPLVFSLRERFGCPCLFRALYVHFNAISVWESAIASRVFSSRQVWIFVLDIQLDLCAQPRVFCLATTYSSFPPPKLSLVLSSFPFEKGSDVGIGSRLVYMYFIHLRSCGKSTYALSSFSF